MRRRRSSDGPNAWPVVADLFLGILAVVVFVTAHKSPDPPQFKDFTRRVEDALNSKQAEAEILWEAPTVMHSEIRFVFTEESLSFRPCRWHLPTDKRDKIVQFFEFVLSGYGAHVERIQIEGHADSAKPGELCRSWLLGEPTFSKANDGSTEVFFESSPLLPEKSQRSERRGPRLWADNLQLSQNRARSVFDVLADGVPVVESLRAEGKVQTAGFGDTRLRDRETNDSAINRRVEVVVKFLE